MISLNCAGYTPLHMAVGYSFVSTVKILLDAGANPEIPDTQGRNVIQLVDSIRSSMPFSPQLASKRIALEEVGALLTGKLAGAWSVTRGTKTNVPSHLITAK